MNLMEQTGLAFLGFELTIAEVEQGCRREHPEAALTDLEAWAAYDVTAGLRVLMEFVVDDLSNWYVRVNRQRFWAPDSAADPDALNTLYRALVTVSRLLAPAAPFVSDWIHRALTGRSVHLAPFPEPGGPRDEPLEPAMDARFTYSMSHSGYVAYLSRQRGSVSSDDT